jgi:hypothetical protein
MVLDNNERFLGQKFAIPSGFVKDVTVLTSNSAEYGFTTRLGIINITPRSGSNETAEVFFITRPGPSIDGKSSLRREIYLVTKLKMVLLVIKLVRNGRCFSIKHSIMSILNTDIKDNLLNVPQLGVTETVRGTNTFELFFSKN